MATRVIDVQFIVSCGQSQFACPKSCQFSVTPLSAFLRSATLSGILPPGFYSTIPQEHISRHLRGTRRRGSGAQVDSHRHVSGACGHSSSRDASGRGHQAGGHEIIRPHPLGSFSLLFLTDERIQAFETCRAIRCGDDHPASVLPASAYIRLLMDGQDHEIPEEVIAHFRNLRMEGSLASKVPVTVFDPIIQDRISRQQAVLSLLPAFAAERCIVFLDPDTGLETQTPTFDHVLDSETQAIWAGMKISDVFAFYQHQTNWAGQPWIEPKRNQLATALGVMPAIVKTASGPAIAGDVVFFFTQKA